ncbi:MAG: SDR family NAD(P)-dependent oxidoreductase [Verrucomicrobia bacterium]|nr:SDR family NAD(P)-dependent oxidoreductase [Verrucomicrobiota bacterium]
MQLTQKTCLITGGTKGIGGATALALAEQGANLALVARHLDQEAHLPRQRIESLGRRCLLIAADMGQAAEARGCVEQTAQPFGSVDVLVHAAGGAVNLLTGAAPALPGHP